MSALPDRAPRIRAVILDLDGTLVDSASEIHEALVRTLRVLSLPEVSEADTRAMIGRGVRVLVERALQRVGGASTQLDAATAAFEAHYAATVGTSAALFAGVRTGLDRMRALQLPLAVVTNKPRFFTERLLARLGVDGVFAVTIAGDDGIRRKPEPDMLLEACRRLGTRVEETLMVGDSDNDIVAARRAGCPAWGVPYGYNEGKPPEALACDRIVPDLEACAALLAA